jgi:hypothetical protein
MMRGLNLMKAMMTSSDLGLRLRHCATEPLFRGGLAALVGSVNLDVCRKRERESDCRRVCWGGIARSFVSVN